MRFAGGEGKERATQITVMVHVHVSFGIFFYFFGEVVPHKPWLGEKLVFS
jgi:hypothetical protein